MPFIGTSLPNGKRFVSMRMKFVGVMVVAGVTILLTALAAIPLTLQLFRVYHTRPERVERRLNSYVQDFALYVAEENVASDDTEAIVAWTRRHRMIYLTVSNETGGYAGVVGRELWDGDRQPYSFPFFYESYQEKTDAKASSETSEYRYVVQFANGLHSVTVVDYSLSVWSNVIIVIGVILALLVFFVVMLLFYHSQIRAIVSLSQEVKAVSNGELTATIRSLRGDEIGQLACDLDAMRSTILLKMEEGERAWQANSELLTSMTHDIRTPLTTLLGYMELLSADSDGLTQEQKEYLRICTIKAEQIKSLSDKLFLYFWAFNPVETDRQAETVEASLLLEQLAAEYCLAMEAKGIVIQADISAISAKDTIRIHVESIRRVADNLFDNLAKYADRRVPVTLTALREEGTLSVILRNAISPKSPRTSSTHIGLRTCENMMKAMDGSFYTRMEDGYFVAVMTLPLR